MLSGRAMAAMAEAELFRTMGHPVPVRVLELLRERSRAGHELLAEIGVLGC